MNDGHNAGLINLAAGGIQATLVTLVGYPFDFVKSRMQTTPPGAYRGALDCALKSVRAEGPFALYRGATAPWISHLMKRPIQYPMAERMKELVPQTSHGSAVGNYLIGGVTGAVGPVFGTPLQVVKVGMQTSKGDQFSTSQYVRRIAREQGLKGFYRGFGATVMKDCLFGASFLGHYYSLRDYFDRHQIEGVPRWATTFFSGAAAHCATWMVLIPVDTIKTRVQRVGETRSAMAIIQSALRHEGVGVLWRGVLPACARTIPVSGVAMVGYEYIRQALS